MLRENRIHELRDNGVVVADDAREEPLAGAQLRDQIVADFLVHAAAGHLAALDCATQFTDRGWDRRLGHGRF